MSTALKVPYRYKIDQLPHWVKVKSAILHYLKLNTNTRKHPKIKQKKTGSLFHCLFTFVLLQMWTEVQAYQCEVNFLIRMYFTLSRTFFLCLWLTSSSRETVELILTFLKYLSTSRSIHAEFASDTFYPRSWCCKTCIVWPSSAELKIVLRSS